MKNIQQGKILAQAEFSEKGFQHPIQVKEMSVEETKAYFLKRIYELSLKTVGKQPQIEEPTYDQKEWVLFRLYHNETWPKVVTEDDE
jgi:hypothetical protein